MGLGGSTQTPYWGERPGAGGPAAFTAARGASRGLPFPRDANSRGSGWSPAVTPTGGARSRTVTLFMPISRGAGRASFLPGVRIIQGGRGSGEAGGRGAGISACLNLGALALCEGVP